MTIIAIVPDHSPHSAQFVAVAGEKQSVGKTAGQALDALRLQLGEQEEAAVIVVQTMRPNSLFTAPQQRRLAELMARWRTARDTGSTLASEEQQELDTLVEAELRAATERSAALARSLTR